jgi:hypothetical protein
MTIFRDGLCIASAEDVKQLRMLLSQDAAATLARIGSGFASVAEYDFDQFLYDFDIDLMKGAELGKGCAVFAVQPDLGAIYGCEPIYLGDFDRQLYSDFIEQSLGTSIADKFSLVAETVAWVSLDQAWFAFGWRSTEIVRCWSGRRTKGDGGS